MVSKDPQAWGPPFSIKLYHLKFGHGFTVIVEMITENPFLKAIKPHILLIT
jgi:hypothetical protein